MTTLAKGWLMTPHMDVRTATTTLHGNDNTENDAMNDYHQFRVQGADSPTLLGRLALMLNRNRVPVRSLEMRPRETHADVSINFEICCTHERAIRVANQLGQLVEINDVSWSTRVAAVA